MAPRLRSATLKQRTTFAFLDLPPELRNNIYQHAFADAYQSINAPFERRQAHIDLRKTVAGTRKVKSDIDPPPLGTPALLLICKTITKESIGYLYRSSLTFRHGLYNLELPQLVNTHVLRNITSLVVTDNGNEILDKAWSQSFDGHRRLAIGLAKLYSTPGHKLRKLELHFLDPHLADHVVRCWNSTTGCDMKKWVMEVYQAWQNVRDVEQVVIKGWLPEMFAANLERLMTSPANPILRLPYHIREQIYLRCDEPRTSQDVTTIGLTKDCTAPTILLIDRQTSFEARNVLSDTPFVIHFVQPPTTGEVDLLHYASPSALQRVRFLYIIIRHWKYIDILPTLVRILMERHRLERFTLHVEGLQPYHTYRLGSTDYLADTIHRKIQPLSELRGITKVNITGEIGDLFRKSLKTKMESRPYGVGESDTTEMYESDPSLGSPLIWF